MPMRRETATVQGSQVACVRCMSGYLLLTAAAAAGCGCRSWLRAARQTDDRFRIGLRRVVAATASRRRRAPARPAATRRRPSVACRAVLHHPRVSTEDVPVQVLG